MKKVISAIVAGAGIAISLATASVASADSVDDYLIDTQGAGLDTRDYEAEIVAIGLGVCVDLLTGSSVRQEFNELISAGASPDQSQAIVDAAVSYLCPSATGRSLR